jgi:outer membrane protein assembly factor BamB
MPRNYRRALISAIACVAAIVLAVAWHHALYEGEQSAAWIDDLKSVRGPRDFWDFVTGNIARRRNLIVFLTDNDTHMYADLLRIYITKDRGKHWPMLGGRWTRNMANTAAGNLPADWCVESGRRRNVRWTADLGTQSYAGPVIADGKVFVGTNNGSPRDKAVVGPKAVLMCFAAEDGKFLWQTVHDMPADGRFKSDRDCGLCSTPCVEGERHYYVTPAGVVVCGHNDTGAVVWRCNLADRLHVVPYDVARCSPLVADGLVMVLIGNGVESRAGDAQVPAGQVVVALNQENGEVAWHRVLPGRTVNLGSWSSPAVIGVGEGRQVICTGSDAWLYTLDVKTGKLVWKCNCNPQRHRLDADKKSDLAFLATPVIENSRCYIGLGVRPGSESSLPYSYLLCLDITGTGDVSPRTLDAQDPANQGSALIWAYGGPLHPPPRDGRAVRFGSTGSTCALYHGFVHIAEHAGYVHCLDAKTGVRYWEDELHSSISSSPYYADDKVFIATEDQQVVIYKHGKERMVLGRVEMDDAIGSSPVVADGVLYVATHSRLYAIAPEP